MSNIYYLGFNRIDQFTSLAMDELLRERAESGDTFVRMFKIDPPAVTIAQNEDLVDVDSELISKKGIALTRRPTPGSAIYIDQNVMCVSIATPTNGYTDAFDAHRKLARRIAQSLRELGLPPLYLGNWFSIRTTDGLQKPNVLAGFSVDWDVKSFLYHGVIMQHRQDQELLPQIIKMRNMGGIDEESYVRNLPVLSDFVNVNDDQLAAAIVNGLTNNDYVHFGKDAYQTLLGEAKVLAGSKYRNGLWVEYGIENPTDKKPNLESNQGYCLADLFYPESRILESV